MVEIKEVSVQELLEIAKKQTLEAAKQFCDGYCKYAAKENGEDICLADICPFDNLGDFKT